MNGTDIDRTLDAIDALVDEQLDRYGSRSGYDHNVNQPQCPHCGETWHGLPITQRMAAMRLSQRVDPDYDYRLDDSPVLCPGSTFIGPMPPSRAHAVTDVALGNWTQVGTLRSSPARPWLVGDDAPYCCDVTVVLSLRDRVGYVDRAGVVRIAHATARHRALDVFLARLRSMTERIRTVTDAEAEPVEQPPAPRPSRTPPMWADNPTRQRRRHR